jgi:hypothetical protein
MGHFHPPKTGHFRSPLTGKPERRFSGPAGRIPPWPAALAAKGAGLCGVVVPADNLAEAGVVEGIEILGARSLGEVVAFFTEGGSLGCCSSVVKPGRRPSSRSTRRTHCRRVSPRHPIF